MKIIRPAAIVDAALVSSNAPETDAPEWAVDTTYALGAVVMVTEAGVHARYESLVADNLGIYPPTDAGVLVGEVVKKRWLRLGPTNRWAMFGGKLSQQTALVEAIEVEIAPGQINAIAFFNLDASSIELTMTDPIEGVVYERAVDLTSMSGITDLYSWFFEPIVRKSDIALFDLPPYIDATLTIRILQPGGTAKCGMVVPGMQRALGGTRLGAQFAFTDYSVKDPDTYGERDFLERGYSKRASVEVWLDNHAAGEAYRIFTRYRATPVVWATSDEHYTDISLIYGILKELTMLIQYPMESPYSLEVDGVTS